MPDSFAEGVEVYYRGFHGYITFVDPEYVTICIRPKLDTTWGDVCVCVLESQWSEIQLTKESGK